MKKLIGHLWFKKAKNGKTFSHGDVTIDGKTHRIEVWMTANNRTGANFDIYGFHSEQELQATEDKQREQLRFE